MLPGCTLDENMYWQENLPEYPNKITLKGVEKDTVYGAFIEQFHNSSLDLISAGTGKDAYLITTRKKLYTWDGGLWYKLSYSVLVRENNGTTNVNIKVVVSYPSSYTGWYARLENDMNYKIDKQLNPIIVAALENLPAPTSMTKAHVTMPCGTGPAACPR